MKKASETPGGNGVITPTHQLVLANKTQARPGAVTPGAFSPRLILLYRDLGGPTRRSTHCHVFPRLGAPCRQRPEEPQNPFPELVPAEDENSPVSFIQMKTNSNGRPGKHLEPTAQGVQPPQLTRRPTRVPISKLLPFALVPLRRSSLSWNVGSRLLTPRGPRSQRKFFPSNTTQEAFQGDPRLDCHKFFRRTLVLALPNPLPGNTKINLHLTRPELFFSVACSRGAIFASRSILDYRPHG